MKAECLWIGWTGEGSLLSAPYLGCPHREGWEVALVWVEVEEVEVEEVAVDCVLWRWAVSIRTGQDRMQQKPTGRALA